jgi:NADH dehydrogenase
MPSIVILGAGYGGVTAAKRFEKMRIPFTIVNRYPYHQLMTLLHEPAGGHDNFSDYQVNLMDILDEELATIVVDRVTRLDPQQNRVELEKGTLVYDYLIVALGSEPEFFGIPGLKENSLQLWDYQSAKRIHEHIESRFAAFPESADPADVTIVVGGAGLTGIELLGELAAWIPELCQKYGINPAIPKLVNVEAASEILPMISPPLRERALQVLTEKGVVFRTGAKIVKVEPDLVHLEEGESIQTKTMIWTGGVRANPLLAAAGFTVDSKGRAKINSTLQSVDHPNVLVIGDCALVLGKNGKPMPPTAQLATQMGGVAAENVRRMLLGQNAKTFTPRILGTLASLGPGKGIGTIRGLNTAGTTASVLKDLTKIRYLWNIGGLKLLAKKRGQLRRI